MTVDRSSLAGARILVVGASSGIGREVARQVAAQGARVAVASRRMALLEPLAADIGGSAYEVDITSPASIRHAVAAAARSLGGIDVLVCSVGVFPLARVEHVDAVTWTEAFATNTIGPALLMSAAFNHLSPDAVIAVASSDKVGRPPAGTAAYSASKAALDEVLRSWRCEHPDLRVIQVGIGPTAGTEITRGSDQELMSELFEFWTREGRVPETMADVSDVAHLIVSTISAARAADSVVAESVQLRPRTTTGLGAVATGASPTIERDPDA